MIQDRRKVRSPCLLLRMAPELGRSEDRTAWNPAVTILVGRLWHGPESRAATNPAIREPMKLQSPCQILRRALQQREWEAHIDGSPIEPAALAVKLRATEAPAPAQSSTLENRMKTRSGPVGSQLRGRPDAKALAYPRLEEPVPRAHAPNLPFRQGPQHDPDKPDKPPVRRRLSRRAVHWQRRGELVSS